MADVKKNGIDSAAQFGGVPYGNRTSITHRLETNSSGVLVASDQATALVDTDVVQLGILPAGMELTDCLAIISDLFNATSTLLVGFEYVDGVDSSAVPEDADYFFAALAASATGRTRANNLAVAPVILPKDAYLIVTIDNADLSAAGIADFVVDGILHGTP